MSQRREGLTRLYQLLASLSSAVGGPRRLAASHGRLSWPTHGLYLFFEDGELREDGRTPRVTRVGTHALTETSRTTLWRRLSQHRGNLGGRNPGGGNHRGSIFRLHVGTALINRDGWPEARASWGKGANVSAKVRAEEAALEKEVSSVIGAMPLLWLDVPDRQARGLIERGAISLLSNFNRSPIDPASPGWLGRHADREAVRESGLWNVNHVAEQAHSDFLDVMERCVKRVPLGATPREASS